MNINDLINNLPNRQMRDQVKSLYTGKFTHKVKCMGDCKGRVIAYIGLDDNGKEYVQPTTERGKMYLRAYRNKRFDGHFGFQCWCGNDSRVAECEKGTGVPTNTFDAKKDLDKILSRLNKKPADYPEKDGKQLIDNFLLEKI